MRPSKVQASSRLLLLGGVLIGAIVFLALFADWLAPQDPNAMSLELRYDPPSWAHPCGLDENGSDVFAKLVYGAQVSLTVAFAVVLISLVVGLCLGSVAGYCGGRWDDLLMRSTDMLYAFPGFLLALGLVAVLGPSVGNLIMAMCLTSWTSYARLVRGEVMHLKEKEFVLTARALGATPLRQVVVHIWPNLVGPILVHASFALAGTILAESSLSFLGLGVPATTPTWGALLNSGRKIMLEAPHVSLFPGLAIMTLVLGFNLFGDGLRDYLDPRKIVE